MGGCGSARRFAVTRYLFPTHPLSTAYGWGTHEVWVGRPFGNTLGVAASRHAKTGHQDRPEYVA